MTPPALRPSAWADLPVITPSLVLDIDVLDGNLKEMAQIATAAGVQLLPHAKTHRMAEAGVRQIQHGADGLTVAKVGEAERFADAGVGTLFVANPIAGAAAIERARLLDRRCDLTLAVDTADGAGLIGSQFAAYGQRARAMLAVDTGLGREGVRPQDGPSVARAIAEQAGIELVGVYTHEGAVYAAEDAADLSLRSVRSARIMVELAEQLRTDGIPVSHVSMGASASARIVASVPGVTQIRPGIYAFNDAGQIALGNAVLATTAVRVVSTVTSHPTPGRACIDAGSKALSSDLVPAAAHRDRYPGHGIVVNAPGWEIERLSEEHGWMRWHGSGEPSSLPVGSRLEIVPNHVCMAFAMLRRAQLVSAGQIVGRWDGFGAGSSE